MAILRPSTLRVPAKTPLAALQPCQLYQPKRQYATQNSLGADNTSKRRQISVVSDDGRIKWGELSAREKAARSTQQSFNFLVIVAGVVMTTGVAYFLYRDIFSPDSKTVQFNRAVSQIRKDPQCQKILGDGKNIRAFGEATWNRWNRNRPIASTTSTDKIGTEHIHMHFHVEGPLASGTARVHMTKTRDDDRFEYQLLAVDVPGHQRIYLENSEENGNSSKASGKLLGIKFW